MAYILPDEKPLPASKLRDRYENDAIAQMRKVQEILASVDEILSYTLDATVSDEQWIGASTDLYRVSELLERAAIDSQIASNIARLL